MRGPLIGPTTRHSECLCRHSPSSLVKSTLITKSRFVGHFYHTVQLLHHSWDSEDCRSNICMHRASHDRESEFLAEWKPSTVVWSESSVVLPPHCAHTAQDREELSVRRGCSCWRCPEAVNGSCYGCINTTGLCGLFPVDLLLCVSLSSEGVACDRRLTSHVRRSWYSYVFSLRAIWQQSPPPPPQVSFCHMSATTPYVSHKLANVSRQEMSAITTTPEIIHYHDMPAPTTITSTTRQPLPRRVSNHHQRHTSATTITRHTP